MRLKPTFHIKRGDRAPSLLYTLPSDVDTTGATAVFSMKLHVAGTVAISRGAATIVAGSPAVLSYAWALNTTDVAGDYDAEFEIVYPGGISETFPRIGYIPVSIIPDIA